MSIQLISCMQDDQLYAICIWGTRTVNKRIQDRSTDPYPTNQLRTELGTLDVLFTPNSVTWKFIFAFFLFQIYLLFCPSGCFEIKTFWLKISNVFLNHWKSFRLFSIYTFAIILESEGRALLLYHFLIAHPRPKTLWHFQASSCYLFLLKFL